MNDLYTAQDLNTPLYITPPIMDKAHTNFWYARYLGYLSSSGFFILELNTGHTRVTSPINRWIEL